MKAAGLKMYQILALKASTINHLSMMVRGRVTFVADLFPQEFVAASVI